MKKGDLVRSKWYDPLEAIVKGERVLGMVVGKGLQPYSDFVGLLIAWQDGITCVEDPGSLEVVSEKR